MTDRYKTVLTWGREVSKIAKKVLMYLVDIWCLKNKSIYYSNVLIVLKSLMLFTTRSQRLIGEASCFSNRNLWGISWRILRLFAKYTDTVWPQPILKKVRSYSMFPIKRTVFLCTATVLKNTVRLIGNIEYGHILHEYNHQGK